MFTSLQKRSVNRSHFRTHCLKVLYLICPPLRLSTHFRTDPMRLLVPHIFPIRSSICYYGYKYFFESQWYEDNVAGKIDDARFARMSKRYEQEHGEIGTKVKSLRLELKKAEGQQMDMEDFLKTVRRYTHVTKITRRMVSELIDHIDVYHAEKQDGITTQQVIIHYNCVGPFMVPDRRKIPEQDILLETKKGVALSYAPAQIAV